MQSAEERLPRLDKADGNAGPALLCYERAAWLRGFLRVAGVDEVGRGPLAGPVLACAIVFPCGAAVPAGLTDSKQLTPARREELAAEIYACPEVAVGTGIIEPADIDRLNILRATHQAMFRAVAALSPAADFLLVDGRPVPGLPVPSQSIVKGDSQSASIAAASIVAKVRRDAIMRQLACDYPEYGFESHKGYGTRAHLAALEAAGPCPAHRQSFAPVRACMPGAPRQGSLAI